MNISKELLLRARTNEDAMREVLTHARPIAIWCWSKVGRAIRRRMTAEDMIGVVAMTLDLAVRHYDGRRTPSTYIIGCVMRAIRREYANQYAHPCRIPGWEELCALPKTDPTRRKIQWRRLRYDPSDHIRSIEDAIDAESILSRFNQRGRLMVLAWARHEVCDRLEQHSGNSFRDVAREIGVSRQAVSQAMRRLMPRIQEVSDQIRQEAA